MAKFEDSCSGKINTLSRYLESSRLASSDVVEDRGQDKKKKKKLSGGCTHLRARDRAVHGAVLENHVGAVASDGRVDLRTKAAGFRQAPLAAARPAAIVHHRGVNGLAHDRFRLDARVERSGKKSIEFAGRREGAILTNRISNERCGRA